MKHVEKDRKLMLRLSFYSEEYSSVITFVGIGLVEILLENDYTASYAISKGLKVISPLKESISDSEGTIQGSSNGIVLDEIILMLEMVHRTLGGGIENFPIKAESFTKPTPTSSYGIVDFPTCWILSVEAGSDE